MKKLEMYSFANAAHTMKQKKGVPYIESICNQRDNVSELWRRVLLIVGIIECMP